jgi:hypothetical protein
VRRFAGACWRRRNNMQATALPLAGRPARGLRGRPLAAHTVSVTARPPQSPLRPTQSATASQASQAPGRVERGWGGVGGCTVSRMWLARDSDVIL